MRVPRTPPLPVLLVVAMTLCGLRSVSSQQSADPACNSKYIQADGSVNVTDILENILKQYDKRLRPNYGGEGVQVNVSMHVLYIGSMSEVGMDFTSDFYFRQFWFDTRLSYASCRPEDHSKLPEFLTVGANMLQHIWVPDTFFVNEKKASFHDATTKNTFLRIRWDGQVKVSLRCTVSKGKPHAGKPSATAATVVYGYSAKDISYGWGEDKPVAIPKEVKHLPQFEIIKVEKTSVYANTSTGTYSRLKVFLTFTRRIEYYLLQIYLPANLIVVISWVSFWLDRGSAPARVALGVTTVLTMTTLISNTNSQLPKEGKFSVQSKVVHQPGCPGHGHPPVNNSVNQRHVAVPNANAHQDLHPVDIELGDITPYQHGRDYCCCGRLSRSRSVTASDIDKYSRFLFPLIYTIFNALFWTVQLQKAAAVLEKHDGPSEDTES
ncbi:PREDICTED: gamma-aminobutyric acid receptor subunit beta-like [Priapulus caudatus]|uniref:Gamma-aminobutyric acid receptor subunit beta-like n=1 Tax=Priapulus caudatus TaxID=37621 RepID=A0ABM1DX99_PRICU|nr:PREDICTED: gamma-aminobutyric acid receptor subunit beta-like [Priapulus caudatus]